MSEAKQFVVGYTNGKYIFPEVLSRKFKLYNYQAVELLNELSEEGIIEKCYDIVCTECGFEKYEILSSKSELCYCDYCDSNFVATRENCKLWYRRV